jgi:hypothetical protein
MNETILERVEGNESNELQLPGVPEGSSVDRSHEVAQATPNVPYSPSQLGIGQPRYYVVILEDRVYRYYTVKINDEDVEEYVRSLHTTVSEPQQGENVEEDLAYDLAIDSFDVVNDQVVIVGEYREADGSYVQGPYDSLAEAEVECPKGVTSR